VGFFAAEFAKSIGIGGLSSPGAQVALDVVLLGLAVTITIASVRRAAIISAALEIMSITLIMVLLIAVYVSGHPLFDSHQLSLSGAKAHGIILAVVLAVLAFIGFESAASLSEEARDPGRSVPRAIRRSLILAAGLYTFATYTQVVAFGTPAKLGASASPLRI
jgi:amino acid transporter